MFNPLVAPLDPVRLEENLRKFWKDEGIVEKFVGLRAGGVHHVFYGMPATAVARPTWQLAQAWLFQDLFLRYRIMRGCALVRWTGWSSHNLSVEVEVEKRLAISQKAQIETYGIERFNEKCLKAAFDYLRDWERLAERLAVWKDLRSGYATNMDDYIDRVWGVFKYFWDEGLIGQSLRVVPYCPRCVTPFAEHEADLGLRRTATTSIYVRLPLMDEAETSLLIWSAEPWKLSGNVAVAVNPEAEYVLVEHEMPEGGKEHLILAQARLEALFGNTEQSAAHRVRVIDSFKGKKLKGKHYRPLFTFLLPDKAAFYLVLSQNVPVDRGTGLMPLAPAFGEIDFHIAIEEDLPLLMTVQEDGTFIAEARPYNDLVVEEAGAMLIEDLNRRGLLLRSEVVQSEKRFCRACGTPLLDYACGVWLLHLADHREKLLDFFEAVNWMPARDEALQGWLEKDWVLSRERFWGTPLPVWVDEDGSSLCLGSLAELAQLSGIERAELDPHLPAIDTLTFPNPKTGKSMHRVPGVLDNWFEMGVVPLVLECLPADLICEPKQDGRAWVYAMQVITALREQQSACNRVLWLGKVVEDENAPERLDLESILDSCGADSLRWYFCIAGLPWNERYISLQAVEAVKQGFIANLWKVFSFFITYANPNGWQADRVGNVVDELPLLDRWLYSEAQLMLRNVTAGFEAYDVVEITTSIESFVDLLADEYLSRSHRRFWNPDSEAERQNAVVVLYNVLSVIIRIVAPLLPHLSEEMYQQLRGGGNADEAPLSVHLTDWPVCDESRVDENLNRQMRLFFKLSACGQAARQKLPTRRLQQLKEVVFMLDDEKEAESLRAYHSIMAEELHAKSVRFIGPAEKEAFLEGTTGKDLMVVNEGNVQIALINRV